MVYSQPLKVARAHAAIACQEPSFLVANLQSYRARIQNYVGN